MTMFALPNTAVLAQRAANALWTVVRAVVVGLPDTLYTWQQRHRMRHELRHLDERMLRDMGISRYDAVREARRPFWKE